MPSYAAVVDHIHNFWPKLIREQPYDQGTLIGLPRPYLVPAQPVNNAMFQEMYYWDSFFCSLGVVDTPYQQLVIDMAENMAALIQRFGVIPNGTRFYFLSRSQPPLFTQQILLAYQVKLRRADADALSWLTEYMQWAEQEHETVWLGTAQPHHRLVHAGLSRYFDINYLDMLASCESGWDHSNRCNDRWLDHVPVDLNSMLAIREQDFATAAELRGDLAAATAWRERAERRAVVMRALFWDDDQGFFFDYDWRAERRTPTQTLAGFFPLWAGIATPQQAAQIVEEWLPRFLKRGGLVTALRAKHGRQWAYPNGWAPLQWIVVAGLERYGYHQHAQRVMRRWCDICANTFASTGALWEKYNVVRPGGREEEGLYGSVPGFGWTNGVFVDFTRRLSL